MNTSQRGPPAHQRGEQERQRQHNRGRRQEDEDLPIAAQVGNVSNNHTADP
jgi:hypothetical protein